MLFLNEEINKFRTEAVICFNFTKLEEVCSLLQILSEETDLHKCMLYNQSLVNPGAIGDFQSGY